MMKIEIKNRTAYVEMDMQELARMLAKLDHEQVEAKTVGTKAKHKEHKRHMYPKRCAECGEVYRGNIGLKVHQSRHKRERESQQGTHETGGTPDTASEPIARYFR